MYKIQANQSGTRSIEISDLHLATIDKYQLMRNLVDSNGIIDETGNDKALLDLCLDVIYNTNMKAIGLHNLVLLYAEWKNKQGETQEEQAEEV